MGDISEEVKDIRNSVAYSIITDLEREGKLHSQRAEALKEKFKRLHEVVVQSFENEKILLNKARDLRQDLTKQLHKLESVSQQQSETSLSLERINKTLEDTQAELDQAEQRVQVLEWEISQIEQDRNEALNYLSQREEEQEAKLRPEIGRLQKLIEDMRNDTKESEDRIIKEEAIKKELQEAITSLSKETEKLQDELEMVTLSLNKAKTEPLRFAKNADILDKAIHVMEGDLNKVKADSETADNELSKLHKEKDELTNLLLETQEELGRCKSIYDDYQKEKDDIHYKKNQAGEVEKELRNNIVELEVNLKANEDAVRRESDNSQELGKQLYHLKKEYKKIENHKRQMTTQLSDLNKQMSEAEERENALEMDNRRQKEILEKLEEEHDIMKKNTMDKEEDEKDKIVKLEEIKKETESTEKKAQNKRTKEGKLVKEMEWLSLKREYMARKASQNIAQAKETSEELKIKELLMIDLKKKKQETDFKLKSYIAMYDEVKNARNKYVKLIQNSSQELAETKERIKILQNEVEILRNESSEKDRKLKEERHNVQQSLHQRDGLRAEINKLDFAVKQKESLVTQEVNEINKLNVIITSLEKEMIELKHKYENVCESRNYTGIQLIDRNDELCILYEKANIQESIQKRGESEIRSKEDEIRMMNLELAEVKRHIEVLRKQIPEVPKLAAEVISLKSELEAEKEKEKCLAADLEDPSNAKRFNELPGEDPDEEALEAKIQVLEERLNNKKEQLLEKELVLEEITNLADKLRAQALTGRQGTLELAEKVNDFQSRIKKLTRKMMATVSELSMFQATAMKLQQEKERLENVFEDSQKRVENSLPPTEDCEKEWERMERNNLLREEERKARKEREEEERSATGAITQSTAEPRLNSYVPDDGIGLPKPYGVHTPFVPTQLGANMRHFRKPVVKPIEI
ncbi:CCDC146 [Blepharisma stoltei]|uniref:Cilia- and flagella-associated protein 58 central coiled coil domain-containing protein n=1 Tax=Blepharisma stoltei TaxID=1481888 RepID=A0AAU9IMQ1_9CILI|nr:unnamed protein product [Blepharisma stoltei]